MVIGDREGQSCDPAFTACVAGRLRALGYSVAVNHPYKGAEIIRAHGRPAEDRYSLQVEMKRALYMDEATITANGGYDKLQADLRQLVAEVAAWTRKAKAASVVSNQRITDSDQLGHANCGQKKWIETGR